MKKLVVPFVMVASLLAVQYNSHAQAAPPAPADAAIARPPADAPQPPLLAGSERGPGRRPGPGPLARDPLDEMQPLSLVTAYTGTVRRLTTNQEDLYDGFLLVTGTDSLLVRFNPELGTQMLKLLKPGSAITANGVAFNSPQAAHELRLVSVSANSQTIMNERNGGPETPVQPEFVTGKGKITGLRVAPDGRTSGYLLDDNKMLSLPAAAMGGLGATVKTGTSIAYSGQMKPRRTGEVSVSGSRVIDCSTITVNGQQYLVR